MNIFKQIKYIMDNKKFIEYTAFWRSKLKIGKFKSEEAMIEHLLWLGIIDKALINSPQTSVEERMEMRRKVDYITRIVDGEESIITSNKLINKFRNRIICRLIMNRIEKKD